MIRTALLFPLLALLLLLAGCDRISPEALAQWERYAAQADAQLDQVQALLPVLQNSASAARAVAEQTGQAEAARLAAIAQQKVEQVQTLLPTLQAAVTGSQTALAAAREAAANGGGWLDLVLVVGTAAAGFLLPGLGKAIAKIRDQQTAIGRLKTAVQIVAQHGDAMEAAPDDQAVEAGKAATTQALIAAQLHGLVQGLRGKV